MVCKSLKKSHLKCGKVPIKQNVEHIPWHAPCIDLIGAYPFGKKDPDPAKDAHVELHCMTMIDPATGWFEIVEIPTKRADYIANILECHWLTRCPWPTPNYS